MNIHQQYNILEIPDLQQSVYKYIVCTNSTTFYCVIFKVNYIKMGQCMYMVLKKLDFGNSYVIN